MTWGALDSRKRPIRVLVVDDSLTVRKYIVEVLSADPAIEVCGVGSNGREAVDLCLELDPDVVTLDVAMPVMDGLEATEIIMSRHPTPIVIVSAAENRGEHFPSFDALAAGAVEVVEKPRADETREGWARELRTTVRAASRVAVITRLPRKHQLFSASRSPPPLASPPGTSFSSFAFEPTSQESSFRVVALAASTGGPQTLAEILGKLPPTFPLPILLVLHLGQSFAAPFTAWLDKQIALPVRLARNGEPLPRPGAGTVLLAPPDRHLIVHDGLLRLTRCPERHSLRPSADVLFESLAVEMGSCTIAGVLTGMGRDGALGLLALRRSGARTFAQNRETSVVFGMPAEAIRLGAAERVLPAPAIARALLSLTDNFEPRHSPSSGASP